MTAADLISERFGDLITEGREILSQCGWDGDYYQTHLPPPDDYLRLRTEAMNLVRRSCGEKSDHYQELWRLATLRIWRTVFFSSLTLLV